VSVIKAITREDRMTQLPAEVVQRDQRLQKSTDELMELRWHWTVDASNPGRLSIAEYAREVGASRSRVSQDANAWADWLSSKRSGSGSPTPGKAQTPSDFRELRKLGEDQRVGAEAVAKATGLAPSTVARSKREEVADVVNTARERAARKQTRVEDEIDSVAQQRAAHRASDQKRESDRKSRHTQRYLEVEGDIAYALRRLKRAFEMTEGVDFTSEERELIGDSIAKLRALLNLLDMRVTGASDVNWDAELAKLTAGE
jgi:hypothetical protein